MLVACLLTPSSGEEASCILAECQTRAFPGPVSGLQCNLTPFVYELFSANCLSSEPRWNNSRTLCPLLPLLAVFCGQGIPYVRLFEP